MPGYIAKAPPALSLGAAGQPLSASVRGRLESSLGVDLRFVRVHSDAAANAAAAGMRARAFTMGPHIFLGPGESAADLELMGHEAAHVVQQQSSATLQTFTFSSSAEHEKEANDASVAVQEGKSFGVTGRTSTRVQTAGLFDFLEDKAWSLLGQYAPELVPILRKGPEGVLDWIKEKITSAFETLFNTLMAPVRAITGAGKWLSAQFAPLLTWMQDAVAKIARNDCTPLREAAETIEKVATAFITPIVEKLQMIAGKIGDVFKAIWAKIGAPVWDWIKQFAGGVWEKIQQFATWIWDKTAPIRNLVSRAWTWIKNKLGIGEGPEGQNGILQWVQRKVESVWEWFKAKIEPYKKQLAIVAGVLSGIVLLASPAGPILIIGGIIVGVVQGVRWIKANWGKGNLVVQARTYLEKTLIPSLIGSMKRMTAAITKMVASVNGKLGELAAGVGGMVSSVAESVLRFAVAAIQWIADQITELVQWGAQKLESLSQWIQTGLERLQKFLEPFIEFLGKAAGLVLDIYGLPLLLAGKLWDLIPKCIRDPFVDWIGPLILGQVAIFRELVKDNEAWQKTKADVMNLIRLVFVKKDLRGAIRATFDLILRVFNVPLELLKEIAAKAAKSWNEITAAPVAFIKNCVRVVGRGLLRYGKNITEHLRYGIEGWLFGAVADKGIKPPKSWTDPKELLGFVVDVLGLSMNHVFDLLKKRFDKDKVEKLRKWWGRITRAWDWIQENLNKSAADVTKGLIDQAKGFGKSIIEGVVVWITERVAAELAAEATAAAASAGLSEVISAIRRIYMAIGAAVRWARRIVDMVNRALDAIGNIIAGVIEPAATVLENAMHIATPAVIGFLGGMVGLGGVGDRIRELIDDLRELVDNAILWLIDKIKAAIELVVKGVGKAVAAVTEWWKRKITVGEGADKHTLSFQGDEENAELYIESSPTKLETMINKLKDDPAYQSPAKLTKLDAAAALIPVIRADRSKARAFRNAGKDADAETLVVKINANFDLIGDYLGVIFKGDPYGTESEPIPIDWPAPPSAAYPIMYFGSRLRPEQRPKKQSVLKSIFRKGQKDEYGKPVLEYYPHVRKQLPDGETIGLTSDYFIPHQAIGPLSTETTPGGGKLDRAIAPYGFTSTDDGMQLDHVHEIQFGGRAKNDRLENLWPLDSSTNASKGSTLSRAPVEFPKGKQTRITELKLMTGKRQFWFKVKSTQ
jgi:hypothetical protein